jgi:hypothetical protein
MPDVTPIVVGLAIFLGWCGHRLYLTLTGRRR